MDTRGRSCIDMLVRSIARVGYTWNSCFEHCIRYGNGETQPTERRCQVMLYLQLFLTFFKIGLFGFGGGYAIAALIQNEVVDVNGWITVADFTDIMAISQATPGPIAINCATYVGYAATGTIWGSALATLAVTLPSVILVGIVSVFFLKFKQNKYVTYAFSGLKPLVVGLLASAAIMLCNPENFIDMYSYVIFGVVAVASVLKVNPIMLLCLSGIAGVLIY